MSTETITVTKRESLGSNASKRLRASGHVPAILYGHGQENINLSIQADVLGNVIKHGTKLLSLTGDIKDTAILRQVQWDTYSTDVLHVDLFRVSATESVEVTLPVHLHGEAPGVGEGGQLVFQTHELTIDCPVASIPDFLVVSVAGLHLGQSIHANEVTLPEGAKLLSSGSRIVVQIVKPSDATDELLAGTAAEPELIRKEKAKEDEKDK
jgi:large subunit ribosomal protein L25